MQTETKHLSLPFTCRSQPGTISVTIQPNRDPEHAWGLDLIFPSIPRSLFATNFHGFPVISAAVTYPVQNQSINSTDPASSFSSPSPPTSTSTSTLGYGCLFGWIQLVKEISFSGSSKEVISGKWEMDIYPWAQDLQSPFVTWGYNPTLFDAPAQLFNEERQRGEGWKDWTAQSFLCVLVDAGMSKRVVPIRGGGFEWGFDVEMVEDGDKGLFERNISIREVKELDVEGEWDGRVVKLLRGWYPRWQFLDAEGSL